MWSHQFYDLIPKTLKRRMSPEDFEILDKIIKHNMNEFIYLNDTFEEYLNKRVRYARLDSERFKKENV